MAYFDQSYSTYPGLRDRRVTPRDYRAERGLSSESGMPSAWGRRVPSRRGSPPARGLPATQDSMEPNARVTAIPASYLPTDIDSLMESHCVRTGEDAKHCGAWDHPTSRRCAVRSERGYVTSIA